MAQRDLYIDRLRSVMTVMVILHHTAITYGAPGGWFWMELKPSASPSSLLLTLFVTTNQAYFMGFFFMLAGYFSPASLERKGYARFIGDRFLRLGLPLLAFGLVLGPLTAAIVTGAPGLLADHRLAVATQAIHQRTVMVRSGTVDFFAGLRCLESGLRGEAE
jgi:fucose 4-O-acetylase-like acetyltransferase